MGLVLLSEQKIMPSLIRTGAISLAKVKLKDIALASNAGRCPDAEINTCNENIKKNNIYFEALNID